MKIAISFDWQVESQGFKVMANGLARNLPKHGVEVARIGLQARVDPKHFDAVISCVSIFHGHTPRPGVPNIAYSMVESDKLPKRSAETLNRYDLVIVPSDFSRNVFEEAGVAVQGVIGLGYDPEVWPTTPRPAPRDTSRPHFLSVAMGARKGPAEFIRAFDHARKILEPHKYFPFATLKARGRAYGPKIHSITQRTTFEAHKALYNAADAFFLPSYGEGYSITPLEALACGLPTFISENSSHMDFPREMFSWLPCNATVAADRVVQGYAGNFAVPDLEEMVARMVDFATNPEPYYDKALAAQKLIPQFTQERFAGELVKWLEDAL